MSKLSYAEIELALQESIKESPTIAKAYENIKQRQSRIKKEQDKFLETTKQSFELADISGDELTRRLISRLTLDKESIQFFFKTIETYISKQNIPFSVKNNKMLEIIDGTLAFLGDDETVVSEIASGKYPQFIHNDTNLTPFCTLERPSQNTFWGTSNVSFLSNTLLTTFFTIENINFNNVDLKRKSILFDDSAIIYHASLPEDLKIQDNYSYFNSSATKENSFGFIHSGYAFGGHRESKQQQAFGPEDCSSWVAKITGCKVLYSTFHQLYAYRTQLKSDYTIPEWVSKNDQVIVTSSYRPIVRVEDTKPGDVYFSRSFKKEAGLIESQVGCAGHTGLLFAKDMCENKLYTLSFNRDMPSREGFGVEESPIEQPKNDSIEKINYFLRPKPLI